MSLRHAIAELISIWDDLPDIIGNDWPDLATNLLSAVDQLPAAASDQDYAIKAAAIVHLLRPYEQVRARLASALEIDDIRSGTPASNPTENWDWLAHKLAVTAARAARGEPGTAAQWIYARFSDHDHRQALRPLRAYQLVFGIDTSPRPDAASTPSDLRFGPGEEKVSLSVLLLSDDADIEPIESSLTVPRLGPSPDRAAFLVTPKHPGIAVISAVFLRDGNFVQLMTLKTHVRDPADPDPDGELANGVLETTTAGRPLPAAANLSERQLGIVVMRHSEGYEIIVSAARSLHATIKLTEAELNDIALEARRELREIIETPQDAGSHNDEDGLIYQSGLDIPESAHQQAIERLCLSGHLMYQRLFFGPGADSQLKQLGLTLQRLLNGPSRRIQIVSDRPALPWHLLCPVTDYVAEDAVAGHIMGFHHEIEYLPLDSSADGTVLDTVVSTMAGIDAMLAVNEDIDNNGTRRLVADQLDYWQRRATDGALRIGICRDKDEVIRALADRERSDQILYFYCHASSGEPQDSEDDVARTGGLMNSELTLTGNTSVLLRELYARAPMRHLFPGNPLVVLNACESAVLTSSYYEGFLPYLIAKGARGVIGTEAVAPAVFAASWAERFFDRLLAGERIGAATLAVRQEFANEHRNVLGLLYNVHCDGDTVLRPGLRQ